MGSISIFITRSHLHYQKGPLGLPHNGDNIAHLEFPKDYMISFQPISPRSIINYKKDIITTFDINVHNVTTMFKVPRTGPSKYPLTSNISLINTRQGFTKLT